MCASSVKPVRVTILVRQSAISLKQLKVKYDRKPSLDEQSALLRELMAEPKVVVAEKLEEVEENDQDFEGVISVDVAKKPVLQGTLSMCKAYVSR